MDQRFHNLVRSLGGVRTLEFGYWQRLERIRKGSTNDRKEKIAFNHCGMNLSFQLLETEAILRLPASTIWGWTYPPTPSFQPLEDEPIPQLLDFLDNLAYKNGCRKSALELALTSKDLVAARLRKLFLGQSQVLEILASKLGSWIKSICSVHELRLQNFKKIRWWKFWTRKQRVGIVLIMYTTLGFVDKAISPPPCTIRMELLSCGLRMTNQESNETSSWSMSHTLSRVMPNSL